MKKNHVIFKAAEAGRLGCHRSKLFFQNQVALELSWPWEWNRDWTKDQNGRREDRGG